MLSKVQQFIAEKQLFLKEDKLILGISGGADSVCLMHVLLSLGYHFELAHCNFNLRGAESDADAIFVQELAAAFKLKLHLKNFETQEYASKHKVSIQMAARDLRYAWFQQLLVQQQAQYIAIAHHANDDVETFFINLIRGTGIEGLLGIKEKNENIVRPLLAVSVNTIKSYLKKNQLSYREDSSNQSTKYLRNKIRHQLLPLLEEMNPNIVKTIADEIAILEGVSGIYNTQIATVKTDLIVKDGENFRLEIKKLLALDFLATYLYEVLNPFGFSEITAIIKALTGQSGKQFFSKTHQLLIDRTDLIISPLKKVAEASISIERETTFLAAPLCLKFQCTENTQLIKNTACAQLDMDKLVFPLVLRKWSKGDKFKPLGMSSFKKLSNFFIDNKFSIIDKQQQWLLCSGEDIIWVVGCRIDERYKLQSNTKKVYLAELLKE